MPGVSYPILASWVVNPFGTSLGQTLRV